MVKKRGKKATRRNAGKSVFKLRGMKLSDYKRKTSLILRNLTMSVILFVLSLGLYYVASGEILTDLLWVTALISGFVSVALVISYLVFLFLKLFGK